LDDRKKMLKIFSDKRYLDSMAVVYEQKQAEYRAAIVERDHRNTNLKSINEDFRTQIANKEELIVNGKEEVKVWKARLTREKTYTALVVLGWLGTTFYFVTK
jgi:hypothetical protein